MENEHRLKSQTNSRTLGLFKSHFAHVMGHGPQRWLAGSSRLRSQGRQGAQCQCCENKRGWSPKKKMQTVLHSVGAKKHIMWESHYRKPTIWIHLGMILAPIYIHISICSDSGDDLLLFCHICETGKFYNLICPSYGYHLYRAGTTLSWYIDLETPTARNQIVFSQTISCCSADLLHCDVLKQLYLHAVSPYQDGHVFNHVTMCIHVFLCYNLILCLINSNPSLHVNTGLQLEKTSSKPRSLSDWPKEEVIKSYRAASHIDRIFCMLALVGSLYGDASKDPRCLMSCKSPSSIPFEMW